MKKLLVATVLIFLLLFSTESAFAYFDKDKQVILSANKDLYVLNKTISTNGKQLVPIGSVLTANNTYYIEYNYTMYVEKGSTADVSIDNILLKSSEKEWDLAYLLDFQIEIDHLETCNISSIVQNNDSNCNTLQITVIVSIKDVINNVDLQGLYGNDISFSLLLRVSKSFSS